MPRSRSPVAAPGTWPFSVGGGSASSSDAGGGTTGSDGQPSSAKLAGAAIAQIQPENVVRSMSLRNPSALDDQPEQFGLDFARAGRVDLPAVRLRHVKDV